MNTLSLVKELKQNKQDHNFYPTTQAIINLINHDIETRFQYRTDKISLLDVGCGNGKTVMSLTANKRYGIEKSAILREQLDSSVIVLGCDLFDQVLFDKQFDVIFSNPAFKADDGTELFPTWAAKVITEARAHTIYLVMPTRWQSKRIIMDAINNRLPEHPNKRVREHYPHKPFTILGTESFKDAERQARITVDVVAIHLHPGEGRHTSMVTDPFENWFKSYFKLPTREQFAERRETELNKFKANALIERRGLVHNLAVSYQAKVDHMLNNYKSLESLDPDLLETIGITLESVMEAVKIKMTSLKSEYWRLLFDQIEPITSRLTKDSRTKLLERIFDNTAVEFTVSNAEAIILWVIKNANEYFDNQFLDMMDTLTSPGNIKAYKSNDRVFKREEVRYNRWAFVKKASHFTFDLRIVVPQKGLSFLSDLFVVCSNLGFDIAGMKTVSNKEWQECNTHEFEYFDHGAGKMTKLMKVRWFNNGNFHLFLCPKLLMKMNVEHGRLRGWIRTAQEASEEMEYPIEQVSTAFGINHQISANTFPLLCA